MWVWRKHLRQSSSRVPAGAVGGLEPLESRFLLCAAHGSLPLFAAHVDQAYSMRAVSVVRFEQAGRVQSGRVPWSRPSPSGPSSDGGGGAAGVVVGTSPLSSVP